MRGVPPHRCDTLTAIGAPGATLTRLVVVLAGAAAGYAPGDELTVRERLVYGDEGAAAQPAAARAAARTAHRLGRLTSHYDEAGSRVLVNDPVRSLFSRRDLATTLRTLHSTNTRLRPRCRSGVIGPN